MKIPNYSIALEVNVLIMREGGEKIERIVLEAEKPDISLDMLTKHTRDFVGWMHTCPWAISVFDYEKLARGEAEDPGNNPCIVQFDGPYNDAKDDAEAYCGNCDEDLSAGDDHWKYCPMCGIKLLWPGDVPVPGDFDERD